MKTMAKRWSWWCAALVLLGFGLGLVAACGDSSNDDDDDDDESGDDDWQGQDNDDDSDNDDDDDQTPGSCLDYAEAFYGTAGCFPDAELYDSTITLCVELSHSENANLGDFFACLNQIDCGSYADVLALYEDIQACQETMAE